MQIDTLDKYPGLEQYRIAVTFVDSIQEFYGGATSGVIVCAGNERAYVSFSLDYKPLPIPLYELRPDLLDTSTRIMYEHWCNITGNVSILQ